MIQKACLAGILSLLASGTTNAQAFNPATEALRQFESYKATIEAREGASVDVPKAITGDLNGDGRTDCLVFFVLTPKGGGNAIVDRQTAVYLNTGRGMKVDGAFPDLEICYVPEAISRGRIRMGSYECAPPYNTKTGTRYYRWQSRKLVPVR
ncbi:MAG: hypothetical protein EOP52_05355 [Sphingobacteriales bacterium]|nr:MAG: hypothetical protein EOP52_05355 [Sphingobacteriales bacterium]